MNKAYDSAKTSFIPCCELRQGDTLSPYLFFFFFFCMDNLSRMTIDLAVNKRHFQGISIRHTCPTISHLFFADDSLFFFRLQECLVYQSSTWLQDSVVFQIRCLTY